MLYSADLEVYNETLPPAIEMALDDIRRYFSLREVSILKYGENHVVVPVVFNVQIPLGGTVGGIDIQAHEPFLIKLSLNRYPNDIPLLLSDRKNFPRNKLSHLYVSQQSNNPAALCLVRNNPSEWFAGKRIGDLLAAGEQWLFKAAIGALVDDGNEFDPTRLEGHYGYHSYKYDLIHDIVKDNQRFTSNYGMALLLSYLEKSEAKEYWIYTTLSAVPFINIKRFQKIISDANKSDLSKIRGLLFSIVVWREDGAIETEYSSDLPKTYNDLKKYFTHHGINIEDVLTFYRNNGYQVMIGIPIIHAVQRPCKIVGQAGNYEFINFVVVANVPTGTKLSGRATVHNQAHIEPFSQSLAQKLTNENRDSNTLFIGSGSLGSKIILHDARSGKLNIAVNDHDDFLQHNLARHVLFQDDVGKNKAEAIIKVISRFNGSDSKKDYKAYNSCISSLGPDVFKRYNWIVDTSASVQVQNFLSLNSFSKKLNISRCEIVDDGKLGLLYIEGKERNPRVDDLINLTYYLSVENQDLQKWRINDAEREITNIDIGLGCSSPTTVMPDDIISFHAALFSKLLYNESKRSTINEKGLIFLSSIETASIPVTKTKHYLVEPFDSFACHAGSRWEVRTVTGLKERLLNLCQQKGNIETGGVLVGLANYKTETIHVFDIVVEPQGSKGTCTGFLRGSIGLPEEIDKIKKLTGGVIGYIGEWHTHPMGLESLSTTDENTITDLIKKNNKIPIPTCAIIVTNQKIIPFIYE